MNRRCGRAAQMLALLGLVAAPARAQISRAADRGSAGECPVVGGISVAVTARDTAGATPRDLVRVDRNTSIDTTFSFDVSERKWAVAELAASVAAGLADTVRGKWYLCAGAGVGLNRPTLTVRGARGQVRLRASLADLSRVLGMSAPRSDPTRTPPRRS
jgi:hypothetical protein